MPRKVIRRRIARADIEEAAAYYLDNAGWAVAERFISAVEAALSRAATHPATGSARYAGPLNRPGLRFWQIKGYPYLIFYLDRGERLDVWRVLQAERDIPACLREE
ncbi:MAG TPA: type II toxin-antitoxin system RelE/ParE family toxin [Rhodanobacteraceae bacterium]|nr:type II toxin-antitoxin system RelE/ParE family toxin [Rhodanobacteraceae bacterium]